MTGLARLAVGLALLAGSLLPASALAGIIVKSTGPSASEFPVGREIPDGLPIDLLDGDKITVLEDGRTRIIVGPGTFVLGEGELVARQSSILERTLVPVRVDSRDSLGATRVSSPEDDQPPRTVFDPDVGYSQVVCVPAHVEWRLWRADTSRWETYRVIDDGGEIVGAARFRGEHHFADLSLEPLDSDQPVMLTFENVDSGSITKLTFRLVDTGGEDVPDLPQFLEENGCEDQYTLLD
ncbi:hypothetical protein OZN62_12605 [Aurantiacibacter sp. MUD11]|uniref:hypothetical protein n=1 Tax=Aurantiacibacter sp. MUD11 TaxID=3003265 RepID=UPI0022AA2F00|nr:hypothetical protein [Aurantiacibacter sp. MUD11]WAT17741.1 hypothetical protein OZN62_12605 [Aurantiacibacter sp. MUD11]